MHFLVRVDTQGNVQRVVWCDIGLPHGCAESPLEVAAGRQTFALQEGDSLLELFHEQARPAIVSMLRRALANDKAASTLAIQPRPSGDHASSQVFSLHAFPMLGEVMVMGICDDPGALDQYTAAYNQLVNAMRREFKDVVRHKEESVQESFDQIQGLNNQLVNMRRKLEKANYQLEAANQGLQADLKKDKLTGLLGQYQFWGEMEQILRSDPEQTAVFVFLDLDDFKHINDHFGHLSGDAVLVEFARRLASGPWGPALAIRIAGDEFGLFLHHVPTVNQEYRDKLEQQLQKHVLEPPIALEAVDMRLSMSIGAAVYSRDAQNVNDLIRFADYAMYQGKTTGKNQMIWFDQQQYQSEQQPRQQVAALQQVLEQRDFYHGFQPVVSAADGQIHGFGSFLRSNHPLLTDPRILLHTALEMGQDYLVEKISIEILLEQQDGLHEQLRERKLFVSQGPYPGFQTKALQDLSQIVQGSELVVEVPVGESTPCSEYADFFQTLRSLGCQVALKHFVAGRGDDLKLLALEPDYVKISLKDLPANGATAHARCLQNIVRYAKLQGTKVIVEAIETEGHLRQALALGPDYLQGYYIGHPGPCVETVAPSIVELLQALSSKTGEDAS